ncbi:hypothetical protein EW14_1490 [Prochlorococcus sp. MIT 0604]|nr:hypothetical protein EW14_1490 [Prochlorococcus sp. MIT 0604]
MIIDLLKFSLNFLNNLFNDFTFLLVFIFKNINLIANVNYPKPF